MFWSHDVDRLLIVVGKRGMLSKANSTHNHEKGPPGFPSGPFSLHVIGYDQLE